jgi:mRNA interferase MazF
VDGMKRGDFVTIAMHGDFGKPRPALVIQSNQFDQLATITVLPVTSTLVDAPLLRITVEPNTENGLQKPSQVMVDKTMTIKCDKVGPAFGSIDVDTMVQVERSLAVFMGIAK